MKSTFTAECGTLIKMAREQGWEFTMTNNSHHQFISPTGEKEGISTSPGDMRAIKNLEAGLKRQGMIVDPEEWKRHKRALRDVERHRTNQLQSRKAQSQIVQLMGLSMGDPSFVNSKNTEAVTWYCAYVAKALKGIELTADGIPVMPQPDGEVDVEAPIVCSCGARFENPVAAATHSYDRTTHSYKPGHRPVLAVDKVEVEDMPPLDAEPEQSERPDIDNALGCPECEFVCYKSEPHVMDDHLMMHGLARCHACSKVMQPGSLEKHQAEYCTVLNELRPPRKRGSRRDTGYPIMSDDELDAMTAPDDPPAPPSAPEAPPVADPAPPAPPPPPVAPAGRPADPANATEQELFALLEIVLDGPVTLDQETFSAVSAWMDATRTLLRVRSEQRSD